MKKTILLATMILFSVEASATYNANMQGELAHVGTYADTDSIYITLKNQPSSHPACNPSYFVIDASVPLDRRKTMLSRLYLALASNETVNVGYDNAGNCADGYIRVHEIG